MTEAQFWEILETSLKKSRGSEDRQLKEVEKQLMKLPAEEVAEFQREFDQRMYDAFAWDLWGAAYVINGGCSDDGFVYFCAWLISRGRKAYTEALKNPDSLADVTDPERDDFEFEELWHIGSATYEAMTKKEMPDNDVGWPKKPRGKKWDFEFDEEMTRRFPRLMQQREQ